MNIVLFTASELGKDHRLNISDQRFQHIRDILGAVVGDTVRIGEVNGLTGSGLIIAIDDRHVEMLATLSDRPPAKLPLKILLALPRPKVTRRIFRTVAELGVEELIVINSYKVEKSFWQSPALEPDKINRYLIEGLQQARDTVLPKISFKRLFKPFVEDELPALIRGRRALIAHPTTGQPCPMAIDEPAVLAIGPEGGFTPYEVEKLMATGFAAVDLGPRILRVENALTALVGKLYS